ncbi:MAG: hypothetical protein GXO16_07720 [Epsilonproteobacteria bacterium]|nr:hypothetical protein [Campylobacterota bacterium]
MKAKFLRKFSLNGKAFEKGQEVELDEKTFKALQKRGVVEEVKPAKKAAKKG